MKARTVEIILEINGTDGSAVEKELESLFVFDWHTRLRVGQDGAEP